MADTFSSGTLITSDWLNAVDHVSYSVEHEGAVGDGVTDDRTALVTAFTNADGNVVHLRGGKTYLLSSAIVHSGDLRLKGIGAEKPIILHSGQSFTPLTVQGALATSTTLSSSVTVHSRSWNVVSATGITAGMLMEVKSSVSWYHDPRPASSDARKSELHKVSLVSGTTIYTEDGANDGYDTSSETVTLSFYNPVKVEIENVVFKCVLPTPAVGADSVTGLQITYADSPKLRNVDVENAAACGVSFNGCYRPIRHGGHTYSANDFDTGYGTNVVGCAHGVVRETRSWQCRRAVDVSGGNIISRHTLIEDNVAFGGGFNSEGTQYGWVDADGSTGAYQCGFGSHGPADGTIYRGNISSNMHNHIACRGRDELIENHVFLGRSRQGLITVTYGENIIVRGCKAYDGRSTLKSGSVFDGGANINSRRADWFMDFSGTYEGRQVGQVVVENNDVQCQDRFINFNLETTVSVVNNLVARNNKVRFNPTASATEVYFVYNEDVSSTIVTGWRLEDNDISRTNGTGQVHILKNIDFRATSNALDVGKTYTMFLADDTATSIPVPSTDIIGAVRVIVDAQGTAYGCVNVTSGSTTTNAIGTPASILCASGVLAGTTGTDGNLNLSLSAGNLYVENRLGLTRRIVLSIIHAL